MTHNSGSQYNISGNTGNVAAGSSDLTQNYSAGFDIATVRKFADIASQISSVLGLEPGQQTELTAAASELHKAIEDPAGDKGRMRRAVEAVLGYLKLASDTTLRNMAIAAGNEAGNELDKVIHHLHP